MNTVTLTIDGQRLDVPSGSTIFDAATAAGIAIPVLCHDPRLRPVGVCRVCAVEVRGARTLQAACVRPAEDGMEVNTKGETVVRARRMLVELLLSDHPSPCARESSGGCELEQLGRDLAVPAARLLSRKWHDGRDESSPVIAVDHRACILCDRCIRACDEIQSNHVIGRAGKGFDARIAFDLGQPMGTSSCVSCGECAAVCPTGALIDKPVTAVQPGIEHHVDSVCP